MCQRFSCLDCISWLFVSLKLSGKPNTRQHLWFVWIWSDNLFSCVTSFHTFHRSFCPTLQSRRQIFIDYIYVVWLANDATDRILKCRARKTVTYWYSHLPPPLSPCCAVGLTMAMLWGTSFVKQQTLPWFISSVLDSYSLLLLFRSRWSKFSGVAAL